ncbi:P-loop containing nucleoside triphosphate hydrolase protein [Aspergillus germanicus]
MSYGAILEWKRSLLNIKRLQDAPGTITIRKIGMTIIAFVRLDDVDDHLLGAMKWYELPLNKVSNAELVLYIPHLPGKLFKDLGDVNPVSMSYTGKLHFQINDEALRRQLRAIRKSQNSKAGMSKWIPLLLNQEPTKLPDIDLLDGIPQDVVEKARAKLLSLMDWNDQRAAFAFHHRTKGGCLLIEGYPGCEKTTVLADMGIFLSECGFKVLLVGSSNAAVEALTRELRNLDHELDYIYIRHGVAERQCLTTAYLANDTAVYGSFGAHADHIMPGLKAMESFRDRRSEGHTAHTVFKHVERRCSRALNTGDSFPIDIANYSGQTPGEEQEDAFAIALTRESENMFNKAYSAISALVIEESQILTCTNNLAGSDIVRKNFTKYAHRTIVIADEDGQANEPDAIIPLIGIDNAPSVVGTIRGGDRHQLPPFSLSASESPGYNEFGDQKARSLFDRLRRAGFPAATIGHQHRMNPRLSRFPSKFTYAGYLTDDPNLQCPDIQPFDLRLLGLDVSNGFVQPNHETSPRTIAGNVIVVMSLIEHLLATDALAEYTCTIVTPYASQKRRYVYCMLAVSKGLDLPYEKCPTVSTIDGMQGREADIIILDWVVTDRDQLCFTSQNRRANAALTRARQCLITVAHGGLLDEEKGVANDSGLCRPRF